MNGTTPTCWKGLLVVGILLSGPAVIQAADKPSSRGQVTRYDLATREDLLLGYLISPQIAGDVPGWTILSGLSDQVGGWITQLSRRASHRGHHHDEHATRRPAGARFA